jgi:hypothetical protein
MISPVSSRTSRTAAASGRSPGSIRPWTVSHDPGQRVESARCSTSTCQRGATGRMTNTSTTPTSSAVVARSSARSEGFTHES